MAADPILTPCLVVDSEFQSVLPQVELVPEVFVFHATYGNIRPMALLALFVMVGLCGSVIAGDFDFEITLGGGHTDNLLSDSSNLVDDYATLNAACKYHPLSIIQIRGTGELAYYSKTSALQNHLWGAGLTIIPISDSAGFSLYGTANMSQRDYRGDNPDFPTNDFSSTNYDAMITAGYVLSSAIRVRTGYSFLSVGYGNEEVAVRKNHGLFLGANFGLPGDNAFDLEGGYSFGNFEYIWRMENNPLIDTPVVRGAIDADEAYSQLTEDDLNSFYLSGRLSRPLGQKTGVSLVLSYRGFIDADYDGFVYGYSSGYISPWVSSYEGNAMMLTVKTYLIPKLIVTAGFGYWDRHYLDVVESITEETFDNDTGEPITIVKVNPLRGGTYERNDDRRHTFLNVQVPLDPIYGVRAEPSIRLGYISNSSSVEVYDHDNFSISTSIRLRF